jgi:hypothetical protein
LIGYVPSGQRETWGCFSAVQSERLGGFGCIAICDGLLLALLCGWLLPCCLGVFSIACGWAYLWLGIPELRGGRRSRQFATPSCLAVSAGLMVLLQGCGPAAPATGHCFYLHLVVRPHFVHHEDASTGVLAAPFLGECLWGGKGFVSSTKFAGVRVCMRA